MANTGQVRGDQPWRDSGLSFALGARFVPGQLN